MSQPQRLLDRDPAAPFVPVVPDTALYAASKKRIGGVLPCLMYVTPAPWVFEQIVDVVRAPIYAAPAELKELAVWATAYENSCRYCYGAGRAILRLMGKSEAWIERVERDAQLADLDDRQRGVLELARRLARSNPRPARAERVALAKLYGDQAAVELAYAIAGACFMNRVSTLLRVPPDTATERFASRWFVPIIRPLIRAMIARPAPRPPEVPLDGPYAPVLEAMGRIPVSFTVRRTIDRALASTILPRRAKLLVLAVVARSMPCTHCELQAVELLAADGLDRSELDEILKNLGSPRLTPIEQALIGIARESLRYDPTALQERIARELVPILTSAQLVEAVGVLALANMIVRLAMLA
jgi:alkylhydroperoxidase family enzyme